jgi:hypothetical protein
LCGGIGRRPLAPSQPRRLRDRSVIEPDARACALRGANTGGLRREAQRVWASPVC